MPVARLAALLPCVALAGLLPVPQALRELLSPGTAEVLSVALPEGPGWRPLSLDPRASLGAATIAAACAAGFWVVARAARDEATDRALRALLVAGGAALAAFGIFQRLVDYDGRAIYWSVRLPDVATPFGPYVNRNHFAGAMLVVLGVAAGSCLHAAAAGRRRAASVFGGAGALAAAALAATTSRGGLVGLAAGAAFLALAARGVRPAHRALGLAAVAALVLGAVFAFGLFPDLMGRLDLGTSARWKNRFAVQWDSLRAFARSPVFGTGAGSFETAYPAFQTVADVRVFTSGHSDWTQFLMETGLLGAAWAVAALRRASAMVRGAAEDTAPARWLALGPAAGCVGVAAHGFFETNLHLPSNALLFALALSLACAASLRDRPRT